MGLFRLFQPHTEEYMLVWNSLAAFHTFQQLSDDKRDEVMEHYARIIALNVTDPSRDIAALTPVDPFWLSFTLADLGVPPMLGPRTAKWFYITNPRRARYMMTLRPEELCDKVIRDISTKSDVVLKLPD